MSGRHPGPGCRLRTSALGSGWSNEPYIRTWGEGRAFKSGQTCPSADALEYMEAAVRARARAAFCVRDHVRRLAIAERP